MDTVVVGAGQAGLAASFRLGRAGVDHVVLERGRVGESWLSQRWDEFRLNTPNWQNLLPGMDLGGADPHAFPSAAEFVSRLARYVRANRLPVLTEVRVGSLQPDGDRGWLVATDSGYFLCRYVVLAAGWQTRPRFPASALTLPLGIERLHSGAYRNADQLPEGGVLVVGSGQSGVQIAEDLLASGRTLYLATSRAGRVPRRYRGRDVAEWWRDSGYLDQRTEDRPREALPTVAQPQISGARGGHTVSLQQLARDGACLLGRFDGARGSRLHFADDLPSHARFADEFSARAKAQIDAWIERSGVSAPAPCADPADEPAPAAFGLDAPRSLDASSIGSVIWATGFGADRSWLAPSLLERDGLHVLGRSWLRSRKSGMVYGAAEDSAAIVAQIARSAQPERRSVAA
ncbi:MAG: NAD(P)-binding domain-containing protein [Thermoleophilaceae bacterium]